MMSTQSGYTNLDSSRMRALNDQHSHWLCLGSGLGGQHPQLVDYQHPGQNIALWLSCTTPPDMSCPSGVIEHIQQEKH